MSKCTETLLKGIAAIIAVPEKELSLTTAAQLSPIVKTGIDKQLTFLRSNTIGIGRGKDTSICNKIIPTLDFAEAKDSESDSVAGRVHSVSVQVNIDDSNADTLPWLLTLEREAHSLILFLVNGLYYVVTSTEDSYQFTVNRDSKTSIEFRIHNLMGIQRCTQSPI